MHPTAPSGYAVGVSVPTQVPHQAVHRPRAAPGDPGAPPPVPGAGGDPSRRSRLPAALLTVALAAGGTAALAPAALAATPPEVAATPVAPGPPADVAWRTGAKVFVRSAGGPARQVATIDRASEYDGKPFPGAVTLSLSGDGRNLVVRGRTYLWNVPLVTGGVPVPLKAEGMRPTSSASVHWSPDGRRLAVLDLNISVCDVEPAVSCRLQEKILNPETTFGFSWKPDGTAFAYLRSHTDPSRGQGRGAIYGDLATYRLADGQRRSVERGRFTKTRKRYPTQPVWTRAGLTWTSREAPNAKDFDTATRVRIRRQAPDGTVRTLSVGTSGEATRFTGVSEAPGGELLGSSAPALDARRPVFSVLRLGADGELAPYGLRIPSKDDRAEQVLGVLPDGRVIFRSDTFRRSVARIYAIAPGAAVLPAPVAQGDDVSYAIPRP